MASRRGTSCWPLRVHAGLSVNLKLFIARFIINVLRCYSLTLSARRRAAREAGTQLCAVPPPPHPHPLVLILLITVILQLATPVGKRTSSSRFRYVTQRVCSHARCTLFPSSPHGIITSTAGGLWLVASSSWYEKCKGGPCSLMRVAFVWLLGEIGPMRTTHSRGKQLVLWHATKMVCWSGVGIWF